MRLFKLSLFSLTFTSMTVIAEPITFLNVNWSMGTPTIKETLTTNGYKCRELEKSTKHVVLCRDGNKKVSVILKSRNHEPHMQFKCESFNGCDKTAEDLVVAFSKRYDISFEKTKISGFDTIIGHGADGDYLRIDPEFNHVSLYKGASAIKTTKQLDF